jgi:hypothetical protein
VTILLVAGIGVAIYFSASEQFALRTSVQVRGLVGSEKIPFFTDPEVIAALADNGLKVEVEKAGSRQIALRPDLTDYDFAFPAGVPAAEKMKREHKVRSSHSIFFTPMTIASWQLIADILAANDVVEQREGVYYVIDLNKLLELIVAETRWAELDGSENYAVNKGMLITSTDIRKSNSAAMYLALASFILNGNDIVTSEEEIDALFEPLSSLFLRQGYMESSSAGPYNDYLVMGPGKSPMVMVYEAQFLHDAALPDSVIQDDMVLLYPEPTVFTKHILLPFSEAGEKLSVALLSDPELLRLQIKHGFRNKNIADFKTFVATHQLAVPDNLVKVIEPPSYEILENTIQRIEKRYEEQM